MGVTPVHDVGAARPLARSVVPAVFVAFAAAVTVAHLVRPYGLDGRVSFLTATCGAALMAWLAVVFRGPDPTRVWLALGVAASAAGDVAWELLATAPGAGPDVSFADLGWITAYLCVAIALVALIRRSGVRWRRSPDVILDAATAAVLSATVVWAFWVSPTVLDGGKPFGIHLVWSAYPVLDAILLAVLVRALLERRERNRPLLLVITGVAMWLLADMGFLLWGANSPAGPALDVGWMLGSVLLAAGAWALTDREVTTQPEPAEPLEARPVTRARTALTIAPISEPWLIEMWAHANGWTPPATAPRSTTKETST